MFHQMQGRSAGGGGAWALGWSTISPMYRNTYLEVANMEDWSYIGEKLEAESSKMNWGYLIGGGSLMVIFCAFVLVSWRHPMASRANVGFLGLLVVNISQVTLGCSPPHPKSDRNPYDFSEHGSPFPGSLPN